MFLSPTSNSSLKVPPICISSLWKASLLHVRLRLSSSCPFVSLNVLLVHFLRCVRFLCVCVCVFVPVWACSRSCTNAPVCSRSRKRQSAASSRATGGGCPSCAGGAHAQLGQHNRHHLAELSHPLPPATGGCSCALLRCETASVLFSFLFVVASVGLS